MRNIFLLLLAFCGTPALAAGPLIWNGQNAKDLSSLGIITNGLSVKNGSFVEKLVAPTLSGNVTLTLPSSTGSNGAVLATDGSGNLSWVGQGTAAAYTISPTAVTAVGGAFSPLGHVLDANDFGAMTTSQYSFFNLSANANDGNTTNAKNLTATGTPTYTTTNVVGTTNAAATLNGTSQYYSSTDTFFTPGNGKSWGVGGWFKATTWAATKYLLSARTSGTDEVWHIYSDTSGNINFVATNTASAQDVSFAYAVNFTNATWHHVAMVFDYPNTKLKAFIDGKLVASRTLANTRAATSTNFRIGAGESPVNSSMEFAGAIEDVFFVNNYAMTDDDIRKLAARRFDHSLAIGPESQLWMGTWTRSDSGVSTPIDSFVVSKDNNHLWADFSGVATGAYVSAKMLNTQSSTTNVSQASYDSGYLSSTPSSTIPHGIGDVPASLVVYYETSTNKFTPLYGSNFCEMDATNLYCDWTSLTVAAGSRVRIQAWAAGSMSSVPAASAAQSGVVNTTSQTFAGAKTWTGAATFSGGISGTTLSLTAQPFVRAGVTGPVAGTANASLTFTETSDVTNSFASNAFTAPSAGRYLLTISLSVASVTSTPVWADGYLKVNAITVDTRFPWIFHGNTTLTANDYSTKSLVLNLAAGDVVTFEVNCSAGTVSFDGDPYSALTITKIN